MLSSLDKELQPDWAKSQEEHSIVKNSLGSGILVGKKNLGFLKNIDLDNI